MLGADDDRELAGAIARAGNVVLASVVTVTEDFGRREDLNPPLPELREGAAGYGFVNLTTDRDAFVRSGPLRQSSPILKGRPRRSGRSPSKPSM